MKVRFLGYAIAAHVALVAALWASGAHANVILGCPDTGSFEKMTEVFVSVEAEMQAQVKKGTPKQVLIPALGKIIDDAAEHYHCLFRVTDGKEKEHV